MTIRMAYEMVMPYHLHMPVLINTMGGFTVVRGKHPIGKGSDDTILLFIREDYTGNITDFSVIMIDGKEYIPNVYYDFDGRKVEG